ncbi:hypothetical protein LSG25_01925 [Paralcaligenes sp. KSB-10]|uniref:hypothetical protein n=1 Tax=Paralcaligenes sp. KSB-10 TaxID=2901142 RepID=UPI001E2BEBEB|nr:hypothetical protein [Paralcaligenes sp. KSB-10]UHL64690.1 hypothetical protein LSG25_01925 [Paralcaligenes sp. KSB-10]
MQAHTTKIPVERRFPVSLTQSIGSIRELYETGKESRWNPEADIAWNDFDAGKFEQASLDAARLVWSRRAWVEYAGLYETPALLVRLCLEAGRESDPKYFLTVRNTEEAWQIESCHRYAKLLGGYIDRPPQAESEVVFNQYRHRQILDAEQDADIFFTVHSAVEDGLELELFRAYLDNATEPVAQQILQKSVQAKERHVAFGWTYVSERVGMWSDAQRTAVAIGVHDYIQNIEMRGYHCPWLSGSADAETRAAEVAALAGLGASTQAREQVIFLSYIAGVRIRLKTFGIELPGFAHPRLGTF